MKYINRFSTAATAVATVALMASMTLAPQVSAQEEIPRTQQPSPAGSVLDGRLSEMNENGAYFAKTPYTDAPASKAVGRLLVAGSLCTGSVVDSPKGNLVLTAAHCIADQQPDGTWKVKDSAVQAFQNGQASITPAFDGTATGNDVRNPYGYWKITNAHVPASSGVDVAILETAPNDQGQNIQSVTGAFGVRGLSEGEVVQASLIGYPGPAPFNANSQSVCVGNYTKHPQVNNSQISRVTGERECWVGGGASGGPYVTNSSDPRLAGDIITVLNSNGGGDIAPLMDELYAAAGNPTDTAEPSESPEPSEPSEPTTVPTTATDEVTATGTTATETTQSDVATKTNEPTATATAGGTTATSKPVMTVKPADPSVSTGQTAPTATSATAKPTKTTQTTATFKKSSAPQTAEKNDKKLADKADKTTTEKKTATQKSTVTAGDNIVKQAKKVSKKDRPVFTTGGSLKQDEAKV